MPLSNDFSISNDPLRIWLFDYDLTLYAESERDVLNSLDRRIALFVQKTTGCDWESAQNVRKEYWQKYGTTLAGLSAVYGVRPDDFFDFIHEPETLIYPESAPRKKKLLDSLKGPRYIFTNGRSDWSRVGSFKMGILGCFRRIVGLEDLDWTGKPGASAYARMENILRNDGAFPLGASPSRITLLDDSLKNLKPAAERGWTTVWVNPVSEEDGSFADLRLSNLMDLAEHLA